MWSCTPGSGDSDAKLHHLTRLEKLDLICLRAEALRIMLVACTTAPETSCPLSGQSLPPGSTLATSESSVPFAGRRIPVILRLHVRRFFCDERSCNRVIFAERLPPGLVGHHARHTNRLDVWRTHVSFSLGGEAGVRLLQDLVVTVSGGTLPKHIPSSAFEEVALQARA